MRLWSHGVAAKVPHRTELDLVLLEPVLVLLLLEPILKVENEKPNNWHHPAQQFSQQESHYKSFSTTSWRRNSSALFLRC